MKTFQRKFTWVESALANFTREAEVWMRLGSHPNIVQATRILTIAGRPHIVMEFVSGSSLREMMRRGRLRLVLRTALAVPVVVAPGGLTLGGGCEISLHGDRVQAAAETYMGLVEVGVGLIPGGGGTKEMLLRATDVQKAFETIAFGKVSTSGPDARRLGYLRDADGITMNRERLITDARTVALALASAGYQRPVRRDAIAVGGPTAFATLALGVHLAQRGGRISEHDAVIGRKLAWILTGGNVPHATTLTEGQLLDLEREAFLSLCGEPKTLERIGYTLRTGKTLRN